MQDIDDINSCEKKLVQKANFQSTIVENPVKNPGAHFNLQISVNQNLERMLINIGGETTANKPVGSEIIDLLYFHWGGGGGG